LFPKQVQCTARKGSDVPEGNIKREKSILPWLLDKKIYELDKNPLQNGGFPLSGLAKQKDTLPLAEQRDKVLREVAFYGRVKDILSGRWYKQSLLSNNITNLEVC
jgi:hypothetical protein